MLNCICAHVSLLTPACFMPCSAPSWSLCPAIYLHRLSHRLHTLKFQRLSLPCRDN